MAEVAIHLANAELDSAQDGVEEGEQTANESACADSGTKRGTSRGSERTITSRSSNLWRWLRKLMKMASLR